MPSRLKQLHKKAQRGAAIFADPTKHRRLLVRTLGYGSIVLTIAWLIGFLASLYYVETDTDTRLDDPTFFLAPHLRSAPDILGAEVLLPSPSTTPNRARIPQRVYAFVRTWPLNGIASVQEHIDVIDVLMPEWFGVNWNTQKLAPLDESRQSLLATYLETKAPDTTVLPVINGFDQGVSFSTPYAIGEFVEQLKTLSDDISVDGLCLDFRWVQPTAIADLIELLEHTGKMLAEQDKQSCVVLRLGADYWPLPEVEELVNTIVFTGFHQPDRGSFPKPIAPHDMFAELATDALSQIRASTAVFALGNVGYDWVTGASITQVHFSEVARLSGLHDVPISFDPISLNSALAYVDGDGRRHQIWITDAVNAHNLLQVLSPSPIGGVAVWPLGGEDAGIWQLLDPQTSNVPLGTLLREVSAQEYVGYEGTGDFLTAFGEPKAGIRTLEVNADTGLIINQTHISLPYAITIARWGAGGRNSIALTFDDGPDKDMTPEILDILKEYDVQAAFFIIGENALKHPEIVQRTLDEGHLLGVHTFTHPNIRMISELRLLIEANSTQRLIASITGYNTVLFRAPFAEDSEPQNSDEAAPLVQLSAAGYITVGTPIDPRDWEGNGVDEIVERVRLEALAGEGNTVLLHDAGGNRSETLAALPRIIEMLRAEGFEFVSLDELLGNDAIDLMPVADDRLATVDTVSFSVMNLTGDALVWMFVIAITLGIARSVIIVVLAYLRRRPKWLDDAPCPPVTVIVPAYNEETVVLRTVDSVLASDYAKMKVIVVDDGSTDKTFDVVKAAYGTDPRVRLVRQDNQGKAQALNHGYWLAHSEIIVAIDADTMILPDAVSRLVRHFANPKVGAVAGNTKVGNRMNMLTRLQAVEYITSQNLDRRAFERFNAILVVPGAIGAWRKPVVDTVGGYSSETLAEDADLTVAIIRAGYRVTYEAGAIAMTEAPETLSQLLRQRLRWSLGIMQTGWKHKRAMREANGIGLVAIPNILLFGVILSLFAPIADFVFVTALIRLVRDFIHHPTMIPGLSSPAIFIAYAAYLLSDVFLSALALFLEPKEDKRLLFWVPFQRFFYRQLLYIAALRSVSRALTGRLTGWQKLTRTANVSIVTPAARYAHRDVELRRAKPAAKP